RHPEAALHQPHNHRRSGISRIWNDVRRLCTARIGTAFRGGYGVFGYSRSAFCASVLRPVRIKTERKRQRPRCDVVKSVILFSLTRSLHLIAPESTHVVLDERLVLR